MSGAPVTRQLLRGSASLRLLLSRHLPAPAPAPAASFGPAFATGVHAQNVPLSHFSTDTAADTPALSDSGAAQALRSMLAHPWHPLHSQVLKEAEKGLLKTSDEAARLALEKTRAAAHAVEVFGEKLELLRMDLDELSGGKFGGESVGQLPEPMKQALVSALQRYSKYLASFEESEEWLRKKVQEELGGQLLLLKQRCAGLESEWNSISLLGTSGLSGSYIEKRR